MIYLVSKEPQLHGDFKKEDWLGQHIFEIHHKDKLVGFVSYCYWDKAYCLSCVYILKEFRNLGIATAVIRKLINKLKDKTTLLYGFVYKNNAPAIKIYKNFGFKFLSKNNYYEIENPSPEVCPLDNDFYEFGLELQYAR